MVSLKVVIDCELTFTDLIDLKIVGIFRFTLAVLGTEDPKLMVRVSSVFILISLLYSMELIVLAGRVKLINYGVVLILLFMKMMWVSFRILMDS